jgi:RNA polymerase subunit RPABC4/transcription elongation factor Spt4
MANILFTCPHCSSLMQLPAALEGKQGNCRSCSSVVTVVEDPFVQDPFQIPWEQHLQQPPQLINCVACSHLMPISDEYCGKCGDDQDVLSSSDFVAALDVIDDTEFEDDHWRVNASKHEADTLSAAIVGRQPQYPQQQHRQRRLKPCDACGHQIYIAAEECPHCGRKEPESWFVLVVCALPLVIFIVCYFIYG